MNSAVSALSYLSETVCVLIGVSGSEPRSLQAQNWQRQGGRVGPQTQQGLQLQALGLSEELLRVLRGQFLVKERTNVVRR